MTAAIDARHLAVGYGSDSVVDGITLTLEPGQALALIGTNGSGKSTLLKTLLGLIPPVAGELRVLGEAPGSQPQRVAYMRQSHGTHSVIPVRSIDVVRMGRFAALGLMRRPRQADHDLVAAAAEAMDVTGFAHQPLHALSGGQQQRVHLAQVLAHHADLLVLDEPTAGLDLAGHERYRTLIRDACARGAAVVTATHDIAEASACDQVLLLNRRVIAQGSPGEVLAAENLLETFGVTLQRIGEEVDGHLVIGAHDHDHRPHRHH